jgi:hypothetical protein
MYNEQTIQEFQQVLEEEYGKKTTPAEAAEILNTLVKYYDLLAKVYHREKQINPP